jgi:hypothetical protein
MIYSALVMLFLLLCVGFFSAAVYIGVAYLAIRLVWATIPKRQRKD